MNCRSVEKFLPGSVDGQVGAFRAWWIERHVRQCPACAAKREELVALRAQVRAELPRYRAPAQLRTRVAALLASAALLLTDAAPQLSALVKFAVAIVDATLPWIDIDLSLLQRSAITTARVRTSATRATTASTGRRNLHRVGASMLRHLLMQTSGAQYVPQSVP